MERPGYAAALVAGKQAIKPGETGSNQARRGRAALAGLVVAIFRLTIFLYNKGVKSGGGGSTNVALPGSVAVAGDERGLVGSCGDGAPDERVAQARGPRHGLEGPAISRRRKLAEHNGGAGPHGKLPAVGHHQGDERLARRASRASRERLVRGREGIRGGANRRR